MFRVCLGVGCALTLLGCETPGKRVIEAQESFIENYNFSPFRPPQEGNDPGTVISFNEQQVEDVVYRPESCILPEQVPPTQVAAGIHSVKYNITSNNSFEWDLGKIFAPQFELDGVIGTNRIATIEFALIEPSLISIEKGKAKEFLQSLDPENSCRAQITGTDPESFVVHMVLAAEGIEYSFADERGQEIDVNAQIVEQVGLALDVDRVTTEDGDLILRRDLNYGYRVWDVTSLSGLLEADVQLTEIEPAVLEGIRRSTSSNR